MQDVSSGRCFAAAYRNTRDAGMSLLEVVVYVGILAVVGGAILSVVLVASRGTAEISTRNGVAERSRSSLYKVTRELRTALGDSVLLESGGSALSFNLPDSYDGTTVVLGPRIRFEFSLSPTEMQNGVESLSTSGTNT